MPRQRVQPKPASRTGELRVLNAIAEALNRSPDVQQALERTLRLVTKLLGLRTGWVWLLDPDTRQFYSAAVQQLPPYLQEPVRMTGYSCWCIEQFMDGALTPRNIDVIECSRLRPAVKKKAVHLTQGLRYHASIPLYFQHKPLGIMNVTGPSWRRLSPDELRLLSTIAYQVGIAIERARLAEETAQGARAEERARIAREIHDTLVQGLTAIGLQLEGALAQFEASPQQARGRLERALEVSRESLEEARRSVLDLRALPLAGKAPGGVPPLGGSSSRGRDGPWGPQEELPGGDRPLGVDRPLAEALAALSRRFTSETGIRVRVRAPAGGAPPPRVEAELLRIAQEALMNVRKHAAAREVEVTLRRSGGRLRLSVRDDGRGFRGRTAPAAGVGILGMHERARLLGGRLRVQSRPGRGTTVLASVPLPARTK